MKVARISCPIAFQAISKIIHLDLFLKTSVEGMFLTTYIDFYFRKLFLAAVPFLVGNKKN
jgi:hypothetical protein